MSAPRMAVAVERSRNRKTGPVAVTMTAQASCPPDCAFLGAGCYANVGMLGACHTPKLNAAAETATAMDVARAEAAEIDRLAGGLPLRLHVVGDCATPGAARLVSGAAQRYMRRTGAPAAWTYTHAWRDVPRGHWAGKVSVLASCETPADVRDATARGWACAVVVEAHPADGRAYTDADGFRRIPCPEQTRGVPCVECKLCWDAGALAARRAVVEFQAHGSKKAVETVRRLNVLQ